jgi:tetratricopeptide (TPR) repeat protein
VARYAEVTESIPAADGAVRFGPSDPETQRARAAVLNRLKMFTESAQSFENAASLRSRDDRLWIELANVREEAGDSEGALAALNEAVRWAPYYAHPRWQRGNVLLRMGRTEDAFADLRQAAKANRRYLPNLIDLAWGISRGDVKTTAAVAGITDDAERYLLIRFLATKGKSAEVFDQMALLNSSLTPDQNQELVRLLVAAKSFRTAFEIAGSSAKGFLNSGFEDPMFVNDTGIGWMISAEKGNRLAIDAGEKFEGTKSLQIVLDGNWTPGTPLSSQTLIVEPEKTYRFSFAVKTKELVTGGPPVMTVSDATSNQLLAKSENLPTASSSWITISFDFTTLASSEAVAVRLQRNNCEPAPCPIFGTLWLDQFHIEQIKSSK